MRRKIGSFFIGIHDVVAFVNPENHFIPDLRYVPTIPNISRFSESVIRSRGCSYCIET